MEGLVTVWQNLEPGRRFIVVLATVGMFAAVLLLGLNAQQKDMALLFGNLEPAAAGEVITALDQRGVAYEVRSNAIYVESNLRDNIRMSLAGEGMPAAGSQGYEILDGLSGFGTTSQMFDAAYWRAREGELARTILANPSIRSARVHISTPSNRPFQATQKTTAAVTITTTGEQISAQQIRALQYLVGSAVNGLTPKDVAVIDDEGGLLSEAGDTPNNGASDDRAEMLRLRAERLLAARVGPGNAIVELSLETSSQTESIIERTVDPDSRIAISTDVTETAETSQDSRGGDVTVASNLPDGAGGGGGTANTENSETRSLTNFEISQTERQIVISPGAVRRMTVAVLINDVATTDANGDTTFETRSPEELQALEQLVSSAVGLDADRGDIITLRSLPFEQVLLDPELGTAISEPGVPLNMMQLIQAAILAVVALVLGLFVVRPIMAGQSKVTALPAPSQEEQGGQMGQQVIQGTSADSETPQLAPPPSPDAVAKLREMILERETETVQILQSWIEDSDKKESA